AREPRVSSSKLVTLQIKSVRQHDSAKTLVSLAEDGLGQSADVPAHPLLAPGPGVAGGDAGGVDGGSAGLYRESSDHEAAPHVVGCSHRLGGEEGGDPRLSRGPSNTLGVVAARNRGGTDLPT